MVITRRICVLSINKIIKESIIKEFTDCHCKLMCACFVRSTNTHWQFTTCLTDNFQKQGLQIKGLRRSGNKAVSPSYIVECQFLLDSMPELNSWQTIPWYSHFIFLPAHCTLSGCPRWKVITSFNDLNILFFLQNWFSSKSLQVMAFQSHRKIGIPGI